MLSAKTAKRTAYWAHTCNTSRCIGFESSTSVSRKTLRNSWLFLLEIETITMSDVKNNIMSLNCSQSVPKPVEEYFRTGIFPTPSFEKNMVIFRFFVHRNDIRTVAYLINKLGPEPFGVLYKFSLFDLAATNGFFDMASMFILIGPNPGLFYFPDYK